MNTISLKLRAWQDFSCQNQHRALESLDGLQHLCGRLHGRFARTTLAVSNNALHRGQFSVDVSIERVSGVNPADLAEMLHPNGAVVVHNGLATSQLFGLNSDLDDTTVATATGLRHPAGYSCPWGRE